MRRYLALTLRALVIVGLAAVSSAAIAQQKTAKQCRDEWRANAETNKKAGITQSAYVKDCRAGTATAQPAAAPAAAPVASATKKTTKQCRDEWRTNEDSNKKAGITESAYVKDCRAGTTTAQPATQPAATPAAAAPATPGAAAAKKTARQCRDEWRANGDANKKAGITESAYVKDCRAGTTTAQPANAPAVAPTPTAAPAPAAAPAPRTAAPAPQPAPAPRPATTTAAAPTGASQFTGEAQAKASCPSDTVVWVNTDSKIYHFSGHADYGKTKEGAFMCEKDAMKAGDRAAKNEKHP